MRARAASASRSLGAADSPGPDLRAGRGEAHVGERLAEWRRGRRHDRRMEPGRHGQPVRDLTQKSEDLAVQRDAERL